MHIVEVMGYGDFDIQQTHSVWVNVDAPKKSKVIFPNADNDENPDAIIQELKRQGYREVKTQCVTYGGNF